MSFGAHICDASLGPSSPEFILGDGCGHSEQRGLEFSRNLLVRVGPEIPLEVVEMQPNALVNKFHVARRPSHELEAHLDRAEDEEHVDLSRADEPRSRHSTQLQNTLGLRLASLIAVHTSVRVAVIFVRGGEGRDVPSVDLSRGFSPSSGRANAGRKGGPGRRVRGSGRAGPNAGGGRARRRDARVASDSRIAVLPFLEPPHPACHSDTAMSPDTSRA